MFLEVKDGDKSPSERKLTLQEAEFIIASWPGLVYVVTTPGRGGAGGGRGGSTAGVVRKSQVQRLATAFADVVELAADRRRYGLRGPGSPIPDSGVAAEWCVEWEVAKERLAKAIPAAWPPERP